ncbi:beta-ribofuranosylaminobenzene 5'-phosphate synthase family protein [Rhodoligotrophos defluvii]|uniref:beta-ribofuranosylaminobenzene 5'-phosphate synthase family protein n=1 Tax=Rhodoligotrophos defluvii TaxID=2561934 RepID=UPI001EF15CC0|nr:beta-ribofuranosylaminobenzene 5'-phosphate synthase family protein [Rhodoligotrophos defluvii]
MDQESKLLTMPTSVSVTVPARLHLGFLDLGGGLGRRFGSLGLAVEAPVTRLTIRAGAQARMNGPDGERAARYLSEMERHLGLAEHSHMVEILDAIPPHAGLGSGTQLALAVAAGLRRLHDLPLDPRGDAARLGRGARSGIGIGLFESGGFAVDGGRHEDGGPPPIIAQHRFPDQWGIILVMDEQVEGAHGPREIQAFQALSPFPASEAGAICRLALMQVLPAVVERDLAAFGSAISEIQARLGDYFAPVQGGRFTSPRVAQAMARLAAAGATGIGQSSWGPTGFAFARSYASAAEMAEALRLQPFAAELDIRVVKASNRKASIIMPAASLTH